MESIGTSDMAEKKLKAQGSARQGAPPTDAARAYGFLRLALFNPLLRYTK